MIIKAKNNLQTHAIFKFKVTSNPIIAGPAPLKACVQLPSIFAPSEELSAPRMKLGDRLSFKN